MIKTSDEGQRIAIRLEKDSLFVDQPNSCISAANGRVEFFRSTSGILVRHNIFSGSFHGLNASQTAFDVTLAPQNRDTTQPFTRADLLREPTYYETARQATIKAAKENGPGVALTAALGIATGAAAPYLSSAASSLVSAASEVLRPAASAASRPEVVTALKATFSTGLPARNAAARSVGAATGAAVGLLAGQALSDSQDASTEQWWDDSDSENDL